VATREARQTPWTIAVFAITLIATFALYQTRGWIHLGVPPINAERVPFSDAAAQLDVADRCARGRGERIGRACFVPSVDVPTHSIAYEPWLTFARWGLTGAKYVLAAVAIIVLFHLAIVLSFRPDRPSEALWLLLFLFSAAIQLAIERANFDLLTSAILCASAACLARRGWIAAAAGCALLGFDMSLKLYSGLASALAWITRRDDRARTAVFSLAATLGVIAWFGFGTIAALDRHAPEGATRFSTGAHWLLRTHGIAWASVAAVLALVVAAFAWRRLRPSAAVLAAFEREPQRVALLQLAFLTAVPLFVLMDSYDYRLVLWLPCLALPLALRRDASLDPAWRRATLAILVLAAIVFCAELPCRWLDGAAGWPHALIEPIVLAKQLSAWILAALLGVVFARVTLVTVSQRERSVPAPAG
jgi:hypothetical protein